MRPTPLLLLSLAAAPSCATVTAVMHEPVTAGHLQRYAAAPDSLGEASLAALAAQGLQVERDSTVADTRMIVARRSVGMTSWGEIDRVAITRGADATEVRILSRPVNALDFLHRDRSPRLYQAIDHELRDAGIRPVAGDRVRVTTADGRSVTGVVREPVAGTGPLSLEVAGAVETLPRAGVARLEVERGSYRNGRTGALIGMLVGAVVGVVVAPDSDEWGTNRVAGFVLGSGAGFAVGAAAGSMVRTRVWSDLTPGP